VPPAETRLLLVGAGHVHLEILRRLALAPTRELETTIVSLEERHFYSGMTPGYLAGQYTAAEITSDVEAIARRVGARCVIGCAARLDPAAQQVALQDGRTLPYDLVSFNIGSLLAGSDGPAAAYAERIKPLHRVARLKERLDALADGDRTRPARVVVIGAGAGGVEVAFAAAATLDRGGRAREITIVDRGQRILNNYGEPFQRLAERALRTLGIRLRLGVGVTAVDADQVVLEGEGPLPSDLTVWLTGPQGTPLLHASGLPTEPRGFLWIEDTLRSVADPRVFAVGDCGTFTQYPSIAKSGVYAVREAPILWHNLLAAARAQPLIRYRPQRSFLSILNTADGRALLRYKGFRSWSRWAWWLKDRIDRGFMRKYQRLQTQAEAEPSSATSQV
jgi:pyridine nucleotide-disulfide oxidoreductase family protein